MKKLLLLLLLTACQTAPPPVTPPDPRALAKDVFLWGYPLVVTERTLQTLAPIAGVNQLFWQQTLANPATRFIVAPNHDTLYCVAVLDLAPEPLVLTVPEVQGRYHTFQFLSAWTDVFGYVGTRATGGHAGQFAIVAPDWTGTLPAGMQKLQSPTQQAFILARFRAVSEADVDAVLQIAPQVTLQPLSKLTGGTPGRKPDPLAKRIDIPQKTGENGLQFWDELGDALPKNLPQTAGQQKMLENFRDLGIGPQKHPSLEIPPSPTRTALEQGLADGLLALENAGPPLENHNGWLLAPHPGQWTDDDTLARALVAHYLWGANVPEEAVYTKTGQSSAGEALDGKTAWQVHFAANQLPPVDAFWSVTLYGPDMFFVQNDAGIYSVSGDAPGLTKNADGSLDILVQQTQPTVLAKNWLPAPAGPFYLMLRMYLPQKSVLDGTWVYPEIRRQ